MAKDSINLRIGAKEDVTGVVKRVKASTVALGVAIGNLASKAITGAVNAMRGWIDEALRSEQANVKLNAALRATGQYSDEAAKKMQALANTIQDEIGGADEAYKEMTAELLTMGIALDKVEGAVRGITALEAIGYKGARAMRAVARAVEGDYAAFNELIPAVRAAGTEQEKLDAINRVMAAGYEQQKANLQTVGGAWAALQGRLGDAREAFIGAIFEGLKLGSTFDEMQVSVGKFLQGEKWNNFLDSIKEGAEFAKEIAGSLTEGEGIGTAFVNLGKLILAALQDGGDYIEDAIISGFGKTTKTENFGKYLKVGWAALGAMFTGTQDEFQAAMFAGHFDTEETKKGTRLQAEINKLLEKKRDKLNDDENEPTSEAAGAETDTGSAPLIAAVERVDTNALIAEKEAQALKVAEKLRLQINALTEKEKTAQQDVTKAKQRLAALYKEGLAGFFERRQDEKQQADDQKKADKKIEGDIERARARQEKVGQFGRISKRDQEIIRLAEEREREIKKQQNRIARDMEEAAVAKAVRENLEALMLTAAEDSVKELKQIRQMQEQLLREGGV